MPGVNRQIRLAVAPVGMPKESDFQLTESPVPRPAGGEVLVRELYLSVDPSIRGRLTGLAAPAKGVHAGEVITGARWARWWNRTTRALHRATLPTACSAGR